MRIQVKASAEQLVRSRDSMHEAVDELADLAERVCCQSDELAKAGDESTKEPYPVIVKQMQRAWEVAFREQMRRLGEDVRSFLERVSREDLQSPHGEGH